MTPISWVTDAVSTLHCPSWYWGEHSPSYSACVVCLVGRIVQYASAGSTFDSIDLVKDNSMKHKGHHIGIAHTRYVVWGGGVKEDNSLRGPQGAGRGG